MTASASFYDVVGVSASVSLSYSLYNCCCDGELKLKDAFDASLTASVSFGFGAGGSVSLPIIGDFSLEVLGPQLSCSRGISFSKECGDPDPSLVFTFGDLSGDIGGSFAVGEFVGLQIEYWSKYSLIAQLVIKNRSASIDVVYGWHGGGKWTINNPIINVGGEFSLYDFTGEAVSFKDIISW